MSDSAGSDESLFPIAVLIDELRHEDVQVNFFNLNVFKFKNSVSIIDRAGDKEKERDPYHFKMCLACLF
jgi:hypothetical protein